MDVEHFTHASYRLSVVIAIVLSGMLVTLAALLGRGTLNLSGSVFLDEPSDVTVIALLEPKLGKDVGIRGIDFLRKEPHGDKEKPFYAYEVKTSDEQYYLVKIAFDTAEKQWVLQQMTPLHADPASGETNVDS